MLVRTLAVFAALFMAAGEAGPAKNLSKPPVYKTPKFKQRRGARQARHQVNKSEQAKRDFRAANPCPSTGKTSGRCPGYEMQHKTPLALGGVEADTNLQWLPKK